MSAEAKCSVCGKRAWHSQKLGDPCQWAYSGKVCPGVMQFGPK